MFIDASDRIEGNAPGLHYGMAVVDADGDGRAEVFVTGFGEPNRLLAWEGTGTAGRLRDTIRPTLADAGRRSIGVAAADVDGDGQEEIYVLNSDAFAGPKMQSDRLFARFGDHWLDLFAQPQNRSAANQTAGRSVCALDRSGRGIYGFAVANYGGPLRLYEIAGGGRIADMAEDAGIDAMGGGRSLLSLPLVSDRMDLFVGNEGGPNHLFRNRGDGTFEDVAARLGLADPHTHARGVAPLDAEGEGRFGLVLGNWEGPHRLFRRAAIATFADAAPDAFASPSRVRTVIVADFDNDGHEEIFVNNIGQPNRLFAWRDDAWVRIDCGDAEEPRGLGTGAVVADLDGDGRLELLIAHGESGRQPLALHRPVPNGNGWIRVQPLTPAGAPARGAVVLCRAGGRIQARAVCAGSGYLCQMEPVAHFGLGRTPRVDEIEVRWPTGAAAVVRDPPAGRLLTVPHPPL
jgi:hypothetical protein